MIDKIKEAYNKHYAASKYTLDSDFVSFEAGYIAGVKAENKACAKMADSHITYPDLSELIRARVRK